MKIVAITHYGHPACVSYIRTKILGKGYRNGLTWEVKFLVTTSWNENMSFADFYSILLEMRYELSDKNCLLSTITAQISLAFCSQSAVNNRDSLVCVISNGQEQGT